jgi:6-phosphogluconolactonase
MSISRRISVALLGLSGCLPSCLCSGADPAPTQVAADSFIVYVGTFPSPKSKGIYSFRFDAATGRPSSSVATLVAESPKPGTLALHPNGAILYAANEIDRYGGRASGAISAYAIREGGRLELLNVQASGGPGPCYVFVDPTGRCALVAHYNGGCISTLPIGPDGRLGEVATFIQHTGSSINRQRQTHAYAHWIGTDAAGRYALVCDLGLDKVFSYRFDAARATLEPNDPPFATVTPGFGPRHLAFHPNGRWAYVINEMGNAMLVFAYDAARGALREIQSLPTLPADFTGENTCAEVAVHPNGRFVYGSNRGHDSIVVYAVDESSGKLSLVEHQPTLGRTPRGFALDPSGRWLLAGNQSSDNVHIFRVDPATGKLTPTEWEIEVGSPSCFVFAKAR